MFPKNGKLNKNIIWFGLGLILLFSTSFAVPLEAGSATLFLMPSMGTYSIGNTFSVSVKINTGGQAINAADAILIFDSAKLEVKSISRTGSIFTLWVQEPIFSNSAGTISFAGGTQSPGFTGSSGTLVAITFKALTSGTASITFSSGSVLADDGKGTNVLSNLISGSYALTTRRIETLPPGEEYVPPPTLAPSAPIISSLTHPDQNKWYSNNNPSFFWELPSGVTGVSLALNQSAYANPGPISDGLMELKEYGDVEDGVWYFHIKFKNQYGWSRITHRKVLIDTVPPNPFVIKIQKESATDPRPILLFSTTDDLSGIEYYKVRIGEGDLFQVTEEDIKTNPYRLPLQAPGKRSIIIKALDEAENFALSSTEIQVFPIESPKILEIPKRIGLGEALEITGIALSDVTIKVFIQKTGQDPVVVETKSNSRGTWELLYDRVLKQGNYEVWTLAQDNRGALSYPSEIHFLEVGLPPFLKIGKIVIDYLNIMLTLIVLIVGAAAVILYTLHRINVWRGRLRRETEEVSLSVNKAFRTLRKKIRSEIEYLNKRAGLTKREKEVRDKLQEALDTSKELIEKEIEDIERELE